jgi:AraC-like DNA-binding protein
MSELLLKKIRPYAEAHVDATGFATTPISGMAIIRATAPSDIMHAVSRPLICLVLQGSKQVSMGTDSFAFAAGDSLLITADVPTLSQVTQASSALPYLSLVFELDMAVIGALAFEMDQHAVDYNAPVRVARTNTEVADAAYRLMSLINRPAAVPVLGAQIMRELHYWLLEGSHGAAIRQLGWFDGRAERIARAVAVLRADYTQALPVERLAAEAAMSLSSFHQHFRAVTTLSPLQFQKQLRLIEARRLMMFDGTAPSNAAFAVGYESVSQFSREYGRMFGLPPGRDTASYRSKGRTVA